MDSVKKVKVISSVHIAATGATYKKGREYDVPTEIADRHIKKGNMKLIVPAKEVAEKAEKTAKTK